MGWEIMAKRVFRKFEAFAMHAHHDAPATYMDLFQKLEGLTRNERVVRAADDLVIGFPIVERNGARFFIQVVEGDDSTPLVLNTETGRTRENILGDAEVLSHATHLVVDPNKRRAAIEFVHRGAKATLISFAIETLLRERYRDLGEMRFEFAPVIRKNFITEINAFERIREANLRVTRPNASWSDRYTELSDFMEESDGDKVEVGINAARSKSLSKLTGIVGVIKEVVSDNQPYLDDAKVVGTRPNEETETTIHAKKHILHTRVGVQADDAGVPEPDDIKTKLLKFLSLL
jgi:hypothetical protein